MPRGEDLVQSAVEASVADAFAALYRQPLASSRTGPLYNAFSYPTKISPEAIALYIAIHTEPGATVMDVFSGSGTTGLAAMLCDRPTQQMLDAAEKLGISPTWGPRKAILYELGAIGSYVSDVMCTPPDPALFEAEARKLINEANEILSPLLSVVDDRGEVGSLRHAIWSEVLECNHCGHEHTFWKAAVKQTPLRVSAASEAYFCPSCNGGLTTGTTPRVTTEIYDALLGRMVEQRKRVPVRIYGKTGARNWQRDAGEWDLKSIQLIEEFKMPDSVPVSQIVRGDLYRSGYHSGLTHLHHFYTRRNLICMSTLLELIDRRHSAVQAALRVLVLSYNQSNATLMTRVVVKDGLSDFVLTGAQSGVLYVSGLPVEKNVLEGVKRKIKAFHDSFELVSASRSKVVVRNKSCTKLDEANDSVDYIFTDPPFADFIPYSEINQLNELWLGSLTDTTQEAIVSPAQGKSLAHYQELISLSFKEINRVLKPSGAATVVFHAAKATVWSALQQAYQSAGLRVVATNVLDKLQSSFKQTVSTVSVKGDPLLLLVKQTTPPDDTDARQGDALLHITQLANASCDPGEANRERRYARYVSRCLETGETVEFDASAFYALVNVST